MQLTIKQTRNLRNLLAATSRFYDHRIPRWQVINDIVNHIPEDDIKDIIVTIDEYLKINEEVI